MLLKLGGICQSVTNLPVNGPASPPTTALIEKQSAIGLNLAPQFADSVISSI
jgi:hypothetical protein